MLEFGVDEMTVVLQAPESVLGSMSFDDWPDVAGIMSQSFVHNSDIRWVYGEPRPEDRCPKGYTSALTLGEHGFYLAIAMHERQPRMGVCVRISAQALAYLVEATGEGPYRMLTRAYAPDDYTMRLSRVDLTADYMDEGVEVTPIYRGLTSGAVAVMREQVDARSGEVTLRRAASKLSGYAVGEAVPTFYLGSRKANVDALLRVYDKKREQEERNGTHRERAASLADWVRFEASLRHGYAAQFGEEMRKVGGDDEFANLIGSVFAQRYQFYEGGRPTAWTQALLDALDGRSIRLFSASSRNGELAASLRYIRDGSGLLPLLRKVEFIWGKGALDDVIDWLLAAYSSYEPNPDCLSWMKKNASDYRGGYRSVDEFLEEV